MTRQTVLLVYGGESAGRDASVRSARSVFAAMDGEKYEVLLGYIDPNGKWWLLKRWVDNLDEHGGTQLLGALGMRSFLELPGYAVLRPDMMMSLLQGASESERISGMAHVLKLPYLGCSPESSLKARNLAVIRDKLSVKGVNLSDTTDESGAKIVIALAGSRQEPLSSVAAYISDDESLRSVDEDVSNKVQEIARTIYKTLRCESYALVILSVVDDELLLDKVDPYPELSAMGTFLKLWRMSDMHYPDIIDLIIASAHK